MERLRTGAKPRVLLTVEEREERARKRKRRENAAWRKRRGPSAKLSRPQFSRYGLSREEYLALMKAQNCRCAICKNLPFKERGSRSRLGQGQRTVVQQVQSRHRFSARQSSPCFFGTGLFEQGPVEHRGFSPGPLHWRPYGLGYHSCNRLPGLPRVEHTQQIIPLWAFYLLILALLLLAAEGGSR